MGWGEILHNSLKDAKGLVDPHNYVRAGKMAVTHPIAFGESVVKSYTDLAKHPIRELQNHPLDTLLSVAPVGRGFTQLAERGALSGVSRTAVESARVGGRSSGLASSLVRFNNSTNPLRLPGRISNEAGLWKDLKYDPGHGIPRNPLAGSVPEAKINYGKLLELQGELGHPNVTHGIQRPPPDKPGVLGVFDRKTQDARTFLHTEHVTAEPRAAAKDLTESMLHEARHGYQKANWSRPKRFVDAHRKYPNRAVEKDANQFMEANSQKYQGLVEMNPHASRAATGPSLPSTPADLGELVAAIRHGQTGVTEEQALTHMQKLVEQGRLHPDDAMDLEAELTGDMRQGTPAKYSPPASRQELFARAAQRARGGARIATR